MYGHKCGIVKVQEDFYDNIPFEHQLPLF